MKHPKHLQHLNLLANFPRHKYPQMRKNQRDGLETIAEEGAVIHEYPTGTGKTAIGYTVLKALQRAGEGPLFYIAPTKTLVEQVAKMFPDIHAAFGRSEHPCLYYPEENLNAQEIPCALLVDCPHRVNQETGKTHEPGAIPCPYLLQKYQAKQADIVACTMAFYLFTRLFSKEFEEPAGLVIDEAHRTASVFRSIHSYEITDWHLEQAVELLLEIDAKAANILHSFRQKLIKIVKRKPVRRPTLLDDREIRELMDELVRLDPEELWDTVKTAVRKRKIDPRAQRDLLKKLEVIARDLNRYLRSLEFSLPSDGRQPLHYTYGYYTEELTGREKAQYRLVIKAYYVAPLVRNLLAPVTLAYSATIGDPKVFGFETGIKLPFTSFPSEFPTVNTRIFLPTDTPNLAMKERRRQDLTRVLRRIARTCKRFGDSGLRSLVIVVSEREREKFLMLAGEERLAAISYGNGWKPKDVAIRFKSGEGTTLVGTAANFGEGIDLPRNIAPIIFFLRPGFPSPDDPTTKFEERRFGAMRWKLWNWRVMMEALQVRGRNIRSAEDLGVTFFISQQFRRFLHAALPQWLQPAYRGEWKFEQCVEETLRLLGRR